MRMSIERQTLLLLICWEASQTIYMHSMSMTRIAHPWTRWMSTVN